MAGSRGRKKGRLGENILTQPRRHVARGHSIHTWFTEPVNYRWPSGVEWLTVMLAPPWIASSMQITRAPSSCRHEFSTIPWRGERLFSTVAAPAIGGCRHRWWIDAREDCKSNLSLSQKIKARDDVRWRRDFVFAVVRQECISFESWIV